MVFHNFLGNDLFFLVGPPPVGNGDLVGCWLVLGQGHLKNFRASVENRKTQFPSARGLKTGQKSRHAVRDGCPQPSYIFPFGRPDPHGRENAKYEDFGLERQLALR